MNGGGGCPMNDHPVKQRGFVRGRGLAVLVIALVAGVGLVTLGMVSIWPTERKTLAARTRELIAATAPLAMEKVDEALLPQATLTGPRGERWMDRAQMLGALETAIARHAITGQRVTIQEVSLRGPQYGLVLVDVGTTFAEQPWGERPIQTRWLLEWWRPDAQTPWRVSRVQWQRHPSPLALQPARILLSQ